MARRKKTRVVAQRAFTDAHTGLSFRPGDEVTGWDSDRAKLYAERGLVKLEAPASGKPAGKPGPKENKEGAGSRE